MRFRKMIALATALLALPLGGAVILSGQINCINQPSWCFHDYEINCTATVAPECHPNLCSIYQCHTCYDETFCPDPWEDVVFCEADNCDYDVCTGSCH